MMANPRRKDMRALKRLGRYLIGNERIVLTFKRQNRRGQIDA